MFIGVDGDVTYREDKQQFIKTVPLDMLVLETDSPFLLPEPLRTQKKYPNTPANLLLIAEFISQVRGENIEDFIQKTSQNAEMLFRLRS
jgi:TatD DNase family protein